MPYPKTPSNWIPVCSSIRIPRSWVTVRLKWEERSPNGWVPGGGTYAMPRESVGIATTSVEGCRKVRIMQQSQAHA